MTEPRPSLQKALEEVGDSGRPLSRRSLQEFSDLDPAAIEIVLRAWPSIGSDRKQVLLDALRRLSDENTLVSFDELALALLSDSEGHVRTGAIRLLDESRDPRLAPQLMQMLLEDEYLDARVEAASALGRFVELGELEEISADLKRRVEDVLLARAGSDDHPLVRRHSLESLGFSGRAEAATLIESAFRRENPDWQISALTAMGRSSDERWEEHVISRLADANPSIRLAAVEAAGELRLGSARTLLFRVLEDEDDGEISSAAIWSLSQLGGEDARLYIQNLIDLAEDEEDIQFLEDALDNLEFTDELGGFDLMSVDPEQD
jgi:HEAT repeat protein